MKTNKTAPSACALLIAATTIIAGCDTTGGTAGIDGTGAPIPSAAANPPAVVTVTAYGTVTAFGSVWVNGVRYDTSQATFTINRRRGDQSELDIGDVVRVVGSFDPAAGTAVARHVAFDNLVEGPISAIDAAGNSFVALGQTVAIDERTAFDDAIAQQSLVGLRIGDTVEVSGFRASDGEIRATRIAAQEFGRREFKTTGAVASLDDGARRFRINGLVVDYGAAMLEAFPSGAITEGNVVEVRGSSLRADGVLVATSVELTPVAFGNAGDSVEIEGYITSPYPLSANPSQPSSEQPAIRFSVERLSVETTSTTVFEGGSWGNLWYDLRVEVEGSLRADGVLIATKVRFSYVDPVAITARVESLNVATGSFTALGITVKTDSLTHIADRSAVPFQPFRLTDLVVGDAVSVRGIEFPANSGEVLASVIERRDATTETEVKGFFQSATHHPRSWAYPEPWFGTIQILGVTFATNENTLYGWDGRYGVNGATFFFDMGPGVLIHGRGVLVGDRTVVATHLLYAE